MKLYLRSKYVNQVKEEFHWLIGPHTGALEVPFPGSISCLSAEPLWVQKMPLDLKNPSLTLPRVPTRTFLGWTSEYIWVGSLEMVLGDSGSSHFLLNPLVL